MTARDQIASMLNELMGPGRNADKNLDLNFRDPDVCKFFLAGFCPNDEFTNTKADLGSCRKVHDENLRIAYRNSESFEKLGYERQFYRYLQRIHDDMRRKIDRNKERLALTQGPQNIDESTKKHVEEKIGRLEREMADFVEVAEKAGLKGDLDRSQKYVKRAEEVNMELESARNLLNPPPPEYTAGYKDPNAPKPMRICEVCGSFLIIGDSQQRIEDHMQGRQHLGFTRIAATIQELKEKFRDLSPDRKRSRSHSPSPDRHQKSRSPTSSGHKSSGAHKIGERRGSRHDDKSIAGTHRPPSKRSRSRDRENNNQKHHRPPHSYSRHHRSSRSRSPHYGGSKGSSSSSRR